MLRSAEENNETSDRADHLSTKDGLHFLKLKNL